MKENTYEELEEEDEPEERLPEEAPMPARVAKAGMTSATDFVRVSSTCFGSMFNERPSAVSFKSPDSCHNFAALCSMSCLSGTTARIDFQVTGSEGSSLETARRKAMMFSNFTSSAESSFLPA